MASGILAVAVPKTIQNYIFWFRPEVIQTLSWAGNPDKTVTEEGGKLTPRSSFHEWKKTYYGKALPWQSWEIEAALELRNLILAADLKEQFLKEQKARSEAERAKKAREDLMAVVSHDLRNPLSSISMNMHLLKRYLATSDEQSHKIADRILRSVSIMSNLITDILSIAKLESGQLKMSVSVAPIGTVIQEAVDMLPPIAAEKNIRLIYEKDSTQLQVKYELYQSQFKTVNQGFWNIKTLKDLGHVLLSDQQLRLVLERILQVLSNLIGNSIKFTPEYGIVSISVPKARSCFHQN